MRVAKTPEGLSDEVPAIAIAAGFFDGVHLGHRQILGCTCECAHADGREAWALTFEPHPLSILAPTRKPKLLTTLEIRLELLAAAGLDGCLVMPFTAEMAALPPLVFVRQVFSGWFGRGHRCTVVSGDNWRFGRNRSGKLEDVEFLSGGSISVVESPMAMYKGERVSSSRIREAVESGRLDDASAMLGRPHMVRGRTVTGRGAGTRMGVATANIVPNAEVMPPLGIYEVAVFRLGHKENGWMKGVASYGFRPTFPDARPDTALLEVHLLDFSGDIHGEVLDVRFVRRLRDEIKFDSPRDLVRQMKLDIEAVRSRQ